MRRVVIPIAALLSFAGTASAQQPKTADPVKASSGHEVTVVIQRVKALDKIDALSKPDFMGRVTIAGKAQTVERVREGEDISPNWRIVAVVPPGRHDIRVEIFDKDLTKNEPIDINRLPKKRHQDFTIDTRTCRIGGFAGLPRCNTPIVRAGDEAKRAEVTFMVSVKK